VNLRVTGQVQTSNAIGFIRTRSGELAKFQDQVASGLRVKSASDDPVAFPALLRVKDTSERLAAFSQSASDASAVLNDSGTALGDVNDVLVRARQIAIEGADAGTNTGSGALEALASEVDGLIDRALRSANAKPDGKPLFAGTATDVTPFRVSATDANGRPTAVTYDGAAESGRALTGPGQTVDTRTAGSAVFQQPGADVFQALIGLRDALRNNTIGDDIRSRQLNTQLGNIDTARTAVAEVRGAQAAALANIEATQTLISNQKLSVDTTSGELEGTDYAEAVVRMKEMETSLQAIYATTAKISQTGILDFIR
jgi:flagellar hook-associated protein 3 FlgL